MASVHSSSENDFITSFVLHRVCAGSSCVSTFVRAVSSCFFVPMVALSVLGNGAVCLVVYRRKSMQSAINLLLASMAFSDALLGALCMFPDLVVALPIDRWSVGDVVCRSHTFLFNLLTTVGNTLLVAISIDRYVILVGRRDGASVRTAVVVVAVVWVYSSAIYTPLLFGWSSFLPPFTGRANCEPSHTSPSYAYVQSAFGFFGPVLAMVTCYAAIGRRLRRNQLRVSVAPTDTPPVKRMTTVAVDVRFKTRTFATVLIVFVSFCVFRLPYAFAELIAGDSATRCNVGLYLLLWSYVNPTVNPVIYAWRIQRFRRAIVEMLPVVVSKHLCKVRFVEEEEEGSGHPKSTRSSVYELGMKDSPFFATCPTTIGRSAQFVNECQTSTQS